MINDHYHLEIRWYTGNDQWSMINDQWSCHPGVALSLSLYFHPHHGHHPDPHHRLHPDPDHRQPAGVHISSWPRSCIGFPQPSLFSLPSVGAARPGIDRGCHRHLDSDDLIIKMMMSMMMIILMMMMIFMMMMIPPADRPRVPPGIGRCSFKAPKGEVCIGLCVEFWIFLGGGCWCFWSWSWWGGGWGGILLWIIN